jgi:ABC-type dipeptide/oligopeptide/nickel transport system ATPase component
MAPPVLEIVNLQTYFYVHDEVRKALEGIFLTLQEGETLGVVGRSGSGKSVLARSIMGLINPPGRIVGGEIRFRGRSLIGLSEEELNRIRGSEITLIAAPARSRLNPLLEIGTQLVNVIKAKQDIPKKEAVEKAIDLLTAVQITDPKRAAKMLPSELSGGMCQRVIIAMALANNPRLILADEPTTGLDVTVQLQVLELAMELVKQHGAALLLMTRDLGVVAHYAHRIAVLKQGHFVEEQETRRFFANPEHPHSKELLAAAFAARGER